MREIYEAGATLLVLEQQVPRALELATEVNVLRRGRAVHYVPAGELPAELASELLAMVGITEP
ncbi:MAG: hypothetical protein ACYCZ8_18810 [Acidimicrobiales bacterium]